MSSLAVRTPEAPSAAPTPVRSIIYLGMDVHKDSITIAVLPQDAKTPTRLERLPNDLPTLKKWIARSRGRRHPRVLRGEWRRPCVASGAAGVGLCVRGHRAVLDPEAPRGTAEARQA